MNKIYSKVFLWLFVGLLVTFATGLYVCTNENMLYNIVDNYWLFILIELGLAIFLGVRFHKMKYTTAMITYLLYAFVTGLTFSSIFVVFALDSIIFVFGVTAILLAIFACIGYFTNIDLRKISTFLFMGLLGVLIMSLINLFLGNSTFDFIISCISIVLFIGYIAYDIQKIKYLADIVEEDKAAVYGAFELYLDFINLFIHLLRIFGKSRD